MKTLKHKFRLSNIKNKAFTLAEVLITLGIIGIVAAITIPNLSVNIRAKKLESAFNKTYSELNQASRLFYAQEDMTINNYDRAYNTFNQSTTQTLNKFMSYFKGNTNNQQVNWLYYDKKLNINNLNLYGEKTSNYPCDHSQISTDIHGRIYAMDDSVKMYKDIDQNIGPKICIDLNGKSLPNKWGVDRFVFVFSATNAVIPYTGEKYESLDENETDENIIKTYCLGLKNHTCAYFALQNKNPNGKGDYWHDFLRGK